MSVTNRDDARDRPGDDPADPPTDDADEASTAEGRPLAPWPLRALSLAGACFLLYPSPWIALVVGGVVLAVRPRVDVFPAWRVALGTVAIMWSVAAVDWLATTAFAVSLIDDPGRLLGSLAALAAVAVEWYVFHRDA